MVRRPKPRQWILVVDDHTTLRDLWIEVLEEAGYAAVGSSDGLAAAEMMRDVVPDLVLLDLNMPRSSGWDFLETLRHRSSPLRIPVVIVSGYLHERSDLEQAGLNIVRCLAKPVPPIELLATVRAIIGGAGREIPVESLASPAADQAWLPR